MAKKAVVKKDAPGVELDFVGYFRNKITQTIDKVKWLEKGITQLIERRKIFQENIAEQETVVDKLIFTNNTNRNLPPGIRRELNALKRGLEPYRSTIKIYKDAILQNREVARSLRKRILQCKSSIKGYRVRLREELKIEEES